MSENTNLDNLAAQIRCLTYREIRDVANHFTTCVLDQIDTDEAQLDDDYFASLLDGWAEIHETSQ